MPSLLRFARSETGAITVDWIVLCATLVAFAVSTLDLVGTTVVASADASVEATAGLAGSAAN